MIHRPTRPTTARDRASLRCSSRETVRCRTGVGKGILEIDRKHPRAWLQILLGRQEFGCTSPVSRRCHLQRLRCKARSSCRNMSRLKTIVIQPLLAERCLFVLRRDDMVRLRCRSVVVGHFVDEIVQPRFTICRVSRGVRVRKQASKCSSSRSSVANPSRREPTVASS